jgi:hypothetical protein
MRQVRLPSGVISLASLFVFGALMSGTTALALLLPGSALAWIWRLNPRAHEALDAMGPWSVNRRRKLIRFWSEPASNADQTLLTQFE